MSASTVATTSSATSAATAAGTAPMRPLSAKSKHRLSSSSAQQQSPPPPSSSSNSLPVSAWWRQSGVIPSSVAATEVFIKVQPRTAASTVRQRTSLDLTSSAPSSASANAVWRAKLNKHVRRVSGSGESPAEGSSPGAAPSSYSWLPASALLDDHCAWLNDADFIDDAVCTKLVEALQWHASTSTLPSTSTTTIVPPSSSSSSQHAESDADSVASSTSHTGAGGARQATRAALVVFGMRGTQPLHRLCRHVGGGNRSSSSGWSAVDAAAESAAELLAASSPTAASPSPSALQLLLHRVLLPSCTDAVVAESAPVWSVRVQIVTGSRDSHYELRKLYPKGASTSGSARSHPMLTLKEVEHVLDRVMPSGFVPSNAVAFVLSVTLRTPHAPAQTLRVLAFADEPTTMLSLRRACSTTAARSVPTSDAHLFRTLLRDTLGTVPAESRIVLTCVAEAADTTTNNELFAMLRYFFAGSDGGISSSSSSSRRVGRPTSARSLSSSMTTTPRSVAAAAAAAGAAAVSSSFLSGDDSANTSPRGASTATSLTPPSAGEEDGEYVEEEEEEEEAAAAVFVDDVDVEELGDTNGACVYPDAANDVEYRMTETTVPPTVVAPPIAPAAATRSPPQPSMSRSPASASSPPHAVEIPARPTLRSPGREHAPPNKSVDFDVGTASSSPSRAVMHLVVDTAVQCDADVTQQQLEAALTEVQELRMAEHELQQTYNSLVERLELQDVELLTLRSAQTERNLMRARVQQLEEDADVRSREWELEREELLERVDRAEGKVVDKQAWEQECRELRRRVADQSEELHAARAETNSLRRNAEALEASVTDMRTAHEEMQRENEELRGQLSDAEQARLELSSKQHRYDEERAASQAEIHALRHDVRAATASLVEMEAAKEELAKEVSDLRSRLTSAEHERTHLHALLEERQRKERSLEETLAERQSQLDTMLTSIEFLDSECQRLRQTSESEAAGRCAAVEERDVLKRRVEQLEKEADAAFIASSMSASPEEAVEPTGVEAVTDAPAFQDVVQSARDLRQQRKVTSTHKQAGGATMMSASNGVPSTVSASPMRSDEEFQKLQDRLEQVLFSNRVLESEVLQLTTELTALKSQYENERTELEKKTRDLDLALREDEDVIASLQAEVQWQAHHLRPTRYRLGVVSECEDPAQPHGNQHLDWVPRDGDEFVASVKQQQQQLEPAH